MPEGVQAHSLCIGDPNALQERLELPRNKVVVVERLSRPGVKQKAGLPVPEMPGNVLRKIRRDRKPSYRVLSLRRHSRRTSFRSLLYVPFYGWHADPLAAYLAEPAQALQEREQSLVAPGYVGGQFS